VRIGTAHRVGLQGTYTIAIAPIKAWKVCRPQHAFRKVELGIQYAGERAKLAIFAGLMDARICTCMYAPV
jgi:hypothetical protein